MEAVGGGGVCVLIIHYMYIFVENQSLLARLCLILCFCLKLSFVERCLFFMVLPFVILYIN